MVQKHVAFAPASQKQLGSRLRSPLSLSHGFFTIQPSPGKRTRPSRAARWQDLVFLGEGNNPETNIGIMHSRKKSERKSQKI